MLVGVSHSFHSCPDHKVKRSGSRGWLWLGTIGSWTPLTPQSRCPSSSTEQSWKGLLRNKGCFQWVKCQSRRWGRKIQSVADTFMSRWSPVIGNGLFWSHPAGPPQEVCMIDKERGETPWSGRGHHSQHCHEWPCPSSVLKLIPSPSFKLLRMVLSGGLLGGCHSPGFSLLWWKTTRQSLQELGRKFSRHQILTKLSLTLNSAKQVPTIRGSINNQWRDQSWSPLCFMLVYLHLLPLSLIFPAFCTGQESKLSLLDVHVRSATDLKNKVSGVFLVQWRKSLYWMRTTVLPVLPSS